MSWDAFDVITRMLLPLLILWAGWQHRSIQKNRDQNGLTLEALHKLQLEVASDYIKKQDLKDMFDGLESRLEKRLDQFVQTFCKR